MATIRPFAALRPKPDLAAKICELPYDVMSSEEAREIASGNSLSFLHVSKPEIDLPPGTDLYAPEVYAKGKENFRRLIDANSLQQDPQPGLYLYRQIMGNHTQVGLVACASCREYLDGTIKKHELTRLDKEDDRVRHIESLNAQTGPVFLVYPANQKIDALIAAELKAPPAVDFTAPDGIRHTSWTIGIRSSSATDTVNQTLQGLFASIHAFYIADGHHRCAAAARIYEKQKTSPTPGSLANESAFFLSVIFPHNQVQILPYNRVLKDLHGISSEQLLRKLDGVFLIQHPGSSPGASPGQKHELGLYLAGQWHRLHFRPRFVATSDPVEKLDVTLLQKYVLEPIFDIEDPRTSKRINFVGGIRGTAELEKLVDAGEYACAFSMFPTSIEDLMAIADRGGLMPPKSTWFEPKLRDAMFCHLL